MQVLNRNGILEPMSFDVILNRLSVLGKLYKLDINYTQIVIKIIEQLYDGILTSKIDDLSAIQCEALSTKSVDYNTLGGLIVASNHQKNTNPSFSAFIAAASNHIDPFVLDFVYNNALELDNMIVHSRDFLIDYFGQRTLHKSYLYKKNNIVIERIQHLWLRVAIGIHYPNMSLIRQTYNLISQLYFIHATPTLFNSATRKPQLSSCYLLASKEDSINGIYDTLKDCANLSKWSGGIGVHIHDIRATGSYIDGTNGSSSGIVPMLKLFNDTSRYISQGAGKRNGSFAIYLEPWHADIESFLELKTNQGIDENKARDLFYGLWIPDLFMKRVEQNAKWSLFCPNECPGLSSVYGNSFDKLYCAYESTKCAKKTLNARDLWNKILDSQMETGTPYILFKDAANSKSNQQNLGTIRSSNLCCEIIEYSDSQETAVCNLASISLTKLVAPLSKLFNYTKLHEIVKIMCRNLNTIIDINFYPTESSAKSNLLHRPIGVGVQGLADVFFLMDIAFHSEEAKQINIKIFETIYHACMETSNELAIERHDKLVTQFKHLYDNIICPVEDIELRIKSIAKTKTDGILESELYNLTPDLCGAYSSFIGSPASNGILQFDMWKTPPAASGMYDWDALKQSIKKYGLRNSLCVAPMPTASTSHILGNTECFEPITSNIYSRKTLAGEFMVVNKYLIEELTNLGLWNKQIKDSIIEHRGSVQHLTQLTEHMRNKYKIVWEIPMKHVIDMSADRGAFICQSQSLNLWIAEPSYAILTSMHFYSWKKGLKTGCYYLRRKPKHYAQQFTIEPSTTTTCTDEICTTCSA